MEGEASLIAEAETLAVECPSLVLAHQESLFLHLGVRAAMVELAHEAPSVQTKVARSLTEALAFD